MHSKNHYYNCVQTLNFKIFLHFYFFILHIILDSSKQTDFCFTEKSRKPKNTKYMKTILEELSCNKNI